MQYNTIRYNSYAQNSVAVSGPRVAYIHLTGTVNFAVKYRPGEWQGALARLRNFSLKVSG